MAVKFDLPILPPDVTISSVKLLLYAFEDRDGGAKEELQLYRFKSAWVPSTADWSSTEGTVNSGNLVTTKVPPSDDWNNVWQEFDVTSAARDMMTNPASNFGFLLITKKGGAKDGYKYRSSEFSAQANRPKLVITLSSTLPLVAMPVITPISGTFFRDSLTVSITSSTAGAVIRYTTDGKTIPTTASAQVPASGSFKIYTGATIIARAFKTGMTGSLTASATFKSAAQPVVLTNPVKGQIAYRYFEGSYADAAAVEKGTPTKQGTTDKMDLSQRNRDENYGMEYSGYIEIPTAGEYTLFTSSDDGSLLYIGDELVVNNDGSHAMSEKSGTYQFKKGFYPIRIVYQQGNGGFGLEVRWSGPGIAKAIIPISQFTNGTPGVTGAITSASRLSAPATVGITADRSIVRYQLPVNVSGSLRVIDSRGVTVYSRSVSGSGSSHLSLPAGVYHAVLKHDGGLNSVRLMTTRRN